jgi:hypothetical protein
LPASLESAALARAREVIEASTIDPPHVRDAVLALVTEQIQCHGYEKGLWRLTVYASYGMSAQTANIRRLVDMVSEALGRSDWLLAQATTEQQEEKG